MAPAASLSTLAHNFAFMFPAFCSAGFTEVGAHATDAVSKFRASRKEGYAAPAQFEAVGML
jgi:hypothetical protein